MNHKEFQKLAVRTESLVDKVEMSQLDKTILINTLQNFYHICEVLDRYKKHIFYRKYDDNTGKFEATPLKHHEVYDHLHKSYVKSAESCGYLSTISESSDVNVETLNVDVRVFHSLLGTITEHGEIAAPLIDHLNGEELDLINVVEELGDSDWYKALFYEATGISWDDVQAMIIKKLEVRYSNKIFNDDEAKDRDLELERKLLENNIGKQVEKYQNNQMELNFDG